MSTLPSLFAGWMDELLKGIIPEESLASCDHCAMLPENDSSAQSTVSFRPDTKCCTYLPDLSNFLVGRILRDHDSASQEGRETVEARINRGAGVTPLGLKQDQKFLTLYRGSRSAFGRSHAMRCPHLLADGRCGVWQHRESTCATWFCKHQRGATGFAFWASLKGLLKSVEQALALWCLLRLGFDPECLDHLCPPPAEKIGPEITSHELDQEPDLRKQKAIWGSWFERERELYQRCAELVDPLDWAAVTNICGPEVAVRSQIVLERYSHLLSREVPERLVAGSFQLVQISANSAKVRTYSEFDPVKMSRTLYEVLPFFDGRPLQEAKDKIKSSKGVTIGADLLRRLVDHRILVADPSLKGFEGIDAK
jgi:hypothetical protein